ncbi:hypothetical protein ACFSO9_15155 [Mesonia maritima]|uniref:hypothetical protein n=1 Tax=Mesonia maritima TaxID=1793873 RepID=UPI003631D631
MMKNYSVYLFLIAVCCWMGVSNAQTVSQTYNSGDIPTAFDMYDSSCNGPVTPLTVTLPSTGGSVWEVTSIDVQYDMTAQNDGWTSDQMSQIYFKMMVC